MGPLHPVDTHNWVTMRSKNNVLGEPTYHNVCVRCGLTPAAVMINNQRCGEDDRSSESSLHRASEGDDGGPDKFAA